MGPTSKREKKRFPGRRVCVPTRGPVDTGTDQTQFYGDLC